MNKPTTTYKPKSTAKQTTSSNSERITKQQLLILSNIYRFRFVSTRQLQLVLGKKQIQQVQQRLNLLLQRGYIGRNYSKTDRLTGQYASYYLLPKGMKLMKGRLDNEGRLFGGLRLAPQAMHNIYKDPKASSRFITHCLGIGDIYNDLHRLYDPSITTFLTKSQLSGYSYLPEPKPDSFLRINTERKEDEQVEYFLEYWEEIVPFWVYRKRIRYYIDYEDEDTWEDTVDTTMPTILLVAETPVLQRRIQRFLKRQLADSYTDAVFLVTNKEVLATAKREDTIWIVYDDEKWVGRSL